MEYTVVYHVSYPGYSSSCVSRQPYSKPQALQVPIIGLNVAAFSVYTSCARVAAQATFLLMHHPNHKLKALDTQVLTTEGALLPGVPPYSIGHSCNAQSVSILYESDVNEEGAGSQNQSLVNEDLDYFNVSLSTVAITDSTYLQAQRSIINEGGGGGGKKEVV